MDNVTQTTIIASEPRKADPAGATLSFYAAGFPTIGGYTGFF
jgi:hypothetical protein